MLEEACELGSHGEFDDFATTTAHHLVREGFERALDNHPATAAPTVEFEIQLGEISIEVTRKDIKNVHLSVRPPDGHVTLAAPLATRLEVARAYAISKLAWIRDQQKKLAS